MMVIADRDVLIVSNARSKPLDPSLRIEPGKIPTTAKMGIDATISDDVPRERFHRITYAYADEIKLDDYLGPADGAARARAAESDIAGLAGRIRGLIAADPLYFAELAERFGADGFQAVARALGELHAAEILWQDAEGRYCLVGSEFAATPPER